MNTIIAGAIWGIILMFCGAFVSGRRVPGYLAIAGNVLLLGLAFLEYRMGKAIVSLPLHDMVKFDKFNLTFIIIMLICTLLFFLLNLREIERVGKHTAEYYALIFFILSGIGLIAGFNTLLILFLGIEIVSIPLYILTGSDKESMKSNEAALKYFLMGAFSTGILLMGITMVYGGNINGSFHIDKMQIGTGDLPVFIAIGLVLILVAMSFKVSAAPFHFWTPDVYDGAPTVFTGFMSTIIKAAAFFAFVRLFEHAFGNLHKEWQTLVVVLIVCTLLVGNITAVFQQSVKRMLAYSSIAQAGFMLFAIFALNETAKDALLVYATAYSLATLGIFSILGKMKDYTIDGFNGLGKQKPVLGFSAVVFLLSLTGIPLTAGFQAKFMMLLAAIQNGQANWLVLLAVLFAAISAFYYFRVIQAIYFKEPVDESVIIPDSVSKPYEWLLLLLVLLIVMIGIYPEIIVGWAHRKA
ncbi:MAG: NADH-quinone oxidoreductase subunit N [Ferruginibacter sp.]